MSNRCSRVSRVPARVLARLASVIVMLVFPAMSSAQPESETRVSFVRLKFDGPYAGKYEPRVGASWETTGDRLRLDIGTAVDLFEIHSDPVYLEGEGGAFQTWLGTEFFTWTRLRGTSSFKFPVEAVDYFFGIYGVARYWSDAERITSLRLRASHISAHLVDGDPSFTSPQQEYFTYSREFLDLLVAHEGPFYVRDMRLRLHAGAEWLFHVIPDTLGVLTPYAGFDLSWSPQVLQPVSFEAGYQARLNAELEPAGEHLARIGMRHAGMWRSGILLEAGYYSGRSQYGQHFGEREEYFSFGFGIDF